MPKELRKRGKRAKKSARDKEEDAYIVYAKPEDSKRAAAHLAGEDYVEEPQGDATVAARSQRHGADAAADIVQQPPERESIWPLLDADTKAYYKQLEEKIISLEQLYGDAHAPIGGENEQGEDADLDDRVLLLRAALNQLSGKETSIAADPETSVILERLIYSMDDFARRVLFDRFTGHFKNLSEDRFASHVIQTLLVLGGGETIERERRGNIAKAPMFSGSSTSVENGELPTMTEGIIAFTREILPDVPSLIASQHGSYILRVLLVLLAGRALPFNSQTSTTSASAIARSKKSAKWKNNRAGGQMKSFVPNPSLADKGKAPEKRIVPKPFEQLLEELMVAVDEALGGGFRKDSREAAQQCRQKSDDPVATGLVQVMLEIEHDQGKTEQKYSLMDRLLEGLITELNANPDMQQPARSDFIETLLRSNVSSHVLEAILTLAPKAVFDLLFTMYFHGRIARLAGHPVANFVVATVAERASKEQIEVIADEIPEALEGIIENSRTGVLQALLEKSVSLNTRQDELHKMLCNAFGTKDEELQYLVPCGLSLMTLKLFKRNPSFANATVKAEYLMQGALLLQSWLRVPRSPVSTSILALPIERLLVFTSDPIASRVIDVFLDESNRSVSYKDRRTFLRNLIGHYHVLADDRIGSRVADRCWATADPFLKAQIATSLLSHEYDLQASHFGHFFLRKVNLPLFKRKPQEWKDRQARDVGGTPAELHARAAKQQLQAEQARAIAQVQAQEAAIEPAQLETEPGVEGKKEKKDKKRKKERVDEIDEVFKNVKPKKAKA